MTEVFEEKSNAEVHQTEEMKALVIEQPKDEEKEDDDD